MLTKNEKIVTFGEIMMRLSTPDYSTINQSHSFLVNYGGGEANVAVALARMGHRTSFLTKLPPNQLGDGAISHLRANGVNTDHIVRGSTTIGIYFLETGFGGRPSQVIYNRKHSAITRLEVDEVDWDAVFEGATWFHISGITLALGKKVREVAFRAAEEAKKHGAKISFDFNFRRKLWAIDEARPVYKKFMPYVDILFASWWDAVTMLGIPLTVAREDSPAIDKCLDVFPRMLKKYNIEYVFGTERTVHSATENSLSGFYFSMRDGARNFHMTNPIRFNIFDRVGGGDAFASGVIHGLLTDFGNPEYAVHYGLNTSVLKHTIYGDASLFSCEEIENFMRSNGSPEIRR